MNRRVILLVEDDPDDVELTLRAFKKSNVVNHVVVACDGAQALDYLYGTGEYAGRNTDVMPTMVLLDLKLPKLDGLEVLQRIRADRRTKYVPVVILTSSKEENDLTNGYKFGANSYIHKPVDFDKFASAVQNLGMYWLVLNEAPPSQRGDSR